jgi:hypothetical protein
MIGRKLKQKNRRVNPAVATKKTAGTRRPLLDSRYQIDLAHAHAISRNRVYPVGTETVIAHTRMIDSHRSVLSRAPRMTAVMVSDRLTIVKSDPRNRAKKTRERS